MIDYKLSAPLDRDDFMRALESLSLQYGVEVAHWDNMKIGNFRHNFSISLRDGNSFWIGAGLNQTRTHWGRVRLDANPNKVGKHAVFQMLLAFLNSRGRSMHTEIKRFDLAVDLPVLRQNVFLIKDNRVYSERRHGQEWTQYLGPRASHAGRVKLYNKQVEAGLERPMTRLELTLEGFQPYESISWPQVYYLRDLQMTFDDMRLTETERFILNALLLGVGTLTDLGRKTREKMRAVMEKYVTFLVIPAKVYAAILEQLGRYLRFPSLPLDDTEIDSDAPLLREDRPQNLLDDPDEFDEFIEIAGMGGLPFG